MELIRTCMACSQQFNTICAGNLHAREIRQKRAAESEFWEIEGEKRSYEQF